jgi:hypothetical protein
MAKHLYQWILTLDPADATARKNLSIIEAAPS